MHYVVRQDREPFGEFDDLDGAIAAAECAFAENKCHSGPPVTFTVTDEGGSDGLLRYSLSNRRITGRFHKQKWGGRKNDYAVPCGHEDFDATHAVLLMNHADLVEMEDNSEETDEIGYSHVQWDGPCSVHIVESVCDFFGVTEVESITDEVLGDARRRICASAAMKRTLTLTVKVNVSIAPEVHLGKFMEDLECSVVSKTPGVVVRETDVVDAQ